MNASDLPNSIKAKLPPVSKESVMVWYRVLTDRLDGLMCHVLDQRSSGELVTVRFGRLVHRKQSWEIDIPSHKSIGADPICLETFDYLANAILPGIVERRKNRSRVKETP